MKVTIRIINPAEIVTHTDAEATFVEGIFYCVAEPNKLYRYRIDNTWLILEEAEEKAAE